MNIGIFTDCYQPIINGVVTSIILLENELKKRGHTIYIFTTTNPKVEKVQINVFRIPSVSFVLYKPMRVGMFHSTKIAKFINKLKLDIIHTHSEFSIGNFGIRMARRLNIPVVHTYHTMYKDYTHYISKGKLLGDISLNIAEYVSRAHCNKCTAVIAPSNKTHDLLKLEYNVKSDCFVIPTGIDLKRFNDHKLIDINEKKLIRKGLNLADDDKILLFVGRIAKEKSIDSVIKQMPFIKAKNKKIKFIVIGEGPYKKNLDTIVKELCLEKDVLFPGAYPWNEIEKIYSIADLYISASKTETQGLTIIEAMASGLPVVAKDDRNIEFLLKNDYNGNLFNEEKEIPNIVLNLIENKSKIKQFVTNNQEIIKEFSSEEFGKRVEVLYIKLINSFKKENLEFG